MIYVDAMTSLFLCCYFFICILSNCIVLLHILRRPLVQVRLPHYWSLPSLSYLHFCYCMFLADDESWQIDEELQCCWNRLRWDGRWAWEHDVLRGWDGAHQVRHYWLSAAQVSLVQGRRHHQSSTYWRSTQHQNDGLGVQVSWLF